MSEQPPARGIDAKGRVDWQAIHRRLAQTEQAITQDLSPDEEQTRAILERRAQELARAAQQAQPAEQTLEIIRFTLAFETYGIESAYVREVHHLKDYTPLPGLPAFVLGIVNLRGEILSVVDIKKFFNLPERGLGELNKVIFLRDQGMEFGIIADAILGVGGLSLDEIKPVPPTVKGIGAEFLKGVTAEGVIILDAQRLLSDKNIVVHQEE